MLVQRLTPEEFKAEYRRRLPPLAMLALICVACVTTCQAATLEEQTKQLESSVQTVEQRRKAAIKDLNASVLRGYRDAIKIDSVDTRVGEVFDHTARIDVTVAYSFDFEKAKAVRASLSKYFSTNTNKEPGIEPYGRIYTNFNDCVGAYCTVKTAMTRLLTSTAVGVRVTFLGIPGTFVTTGMEGTYELTPDTVTIQFEVPKSKIKGDPTPVVAAQVFDVHFCPSDPDCSGYRYTIKK